jgi:hypothetical protein
MLCVVENEVMIAGFLGEGANQFVIVGLVPALSTANAVDINSDSEWLHQRE